MLKSLPTILFFLLLTSVLSGQALRGTVVNDDGEFLFGATIVWDGSSTGTVADENGAFELPRQDTTAFLRIEYVGYEAVYVEVLPEENDLEITVSGITELMSVEVAAKRRDSYVSTLSTLNIETLGAGEFRKAPCCNLAESFQTNAGIDVSYNDAVTGAREIRMLGLRGTYTQLLMEKRPFMTGLGSAFIMEYIPGTWLSSIQISKGPSSVQSGYQAITGQINAELVKPFQDHPVFVNLYGSTFGRGEANIHLNHQLSDKWSSGLLLHASTRQNQLDQNNDNFYDTPQKTLYDAIWRTFYRGNVFRSQFNVHLLSDRHQAGQIPEQVSGRPYIIEQDHDRLEVFAKAGYLGFEDPSLTVGFIGEAGWHRLESFYGNRRHYGTQRNAYINAMFSNGFGGAQHQLDVGLSYLYDDFDEYLDDRDISRTERVPGAFAEYQLKSLVRECVDDPETFANKFGAVVGLRVDHHNLFGWLVTPRANLKYNFSENSVVRLSGGRGYRTANVIAENISVLASNRAIIIANDLDMEDAWNMGANFTQNFQLGEREISISLDAYRTQFNNQVVLDMDSDYQLAQFYNLPGKSFANSFLSMLSLNLIKGLDVKLAYKLNDVRTTFLDGQLRERPMVAKHRGLVAVEYNTPNEKWMFNTDAQLVGQQRFVHLSDNPARTELQARGQAPAYVLFNAQLTRRFGSQFEVYLGGENLGSYRQQEAIIDWENPFGENFDASQMYAPLTGRMIFLGARWWLARK